MRQGVANLATVKRAGMKISEGVYEYEGAFHVDAEEFLAAYGQKPTPQNIATLLNAACARGTADCPTTIMLELQPPAGPIDPDRRLEEFNRRGGR